MTGLLIMVLVFVVSFVIGYILISKVPPLLHTPLMSMTNAISAVTILAALLLFASETSPAVQVLGGVALATAAFNLVGGYAITDRMLRMFRRGTSRG
jgi:NAD(P) transhydrogenase subunit alpha